jgi:hypothetical protein
LLNRMVGIPARLVLPALILAVAVPAGYAQQPTPAEAQQQREHVVRRGDTLWDLARTYLSNPFLWPLIYEANRNVVENPHWIYPAERLIIPPVLQRFQQAEPIGHPPLPPVERPPEALVEPPADTTPTLVTTLDMRRPVLSEGEYVRLPWLSPAADPGITGRIQGRAGVVADSDRIASALYPNERVHVAITAGALPTLGDTLVVIRPGRRIGTHGTVIEPVAMLRVDTVLASGVLARIVSQFGETRVGDVVMPLRPVPAIGMGPAEPITGGVEGSILQFLVPGALYGTTQLAFISVGRAHGAGIGDEFEVYLPGSADQPPVGVAVVRAVHVGERTATVRVISVNSTGLREGLPIRMVRRMP